MASPLNYKVYDRRGQYVAACRWMEDAACLVALHGEGAIIKSWHGWIVWREGQEDQSASESYDHVAEVINQRIDKGNTRILARYNTQKG